MQFGVFIPSAFMSSDTAGYSSVTRLSIPGVDGHVDTLILSGDTANGAAGTAWV